MVLTPGDRLPRIFFGWSWGLGRGFVPNKYSNKKPHCVGDCGICGLFVGAAFPSHAGCHLGPN